MQLNPHREMTWSGNKVHQETHLNLKIRDSRTKGGYELDTKVQWTLDRTSKCYLMWCSSKEDTDKNNKRWIDLTLFCYFIGMVV